MTEKDLESILWKSIAFMARDSDKVLLFECKSQSQAESLLRLLKNNLFNLKVLVNEKTGNYSMDIIFPHTEFGIHNNLAMTQQKYPQLAWLHNQQITHIATGYRDSENKLQFLPDFHPLDSQINLN